MTRAQFTRIDPTFMILIAAVISAAVFASLVSSKSVVVISVLSGRSGGSMSS